MWRWTTEPFSWCLFSMCCLCSLVTRIGRRMLLGKYLHVASHRQWRPAGCSEPFQRVRLVNSDWNIARYDSSFLNSIIRHYCPGMTQHWHLLFGHGEWNASFCVADRLVFFLRMNGLHACLPPPPIPVWQAMPLQLKEISMSSVVADEWSKWNQCHTSRTLGKVRKYRLIMD